MNQQLHSAQQAQDDQSAIWEQKYKILAEKLANFQHQYKKIDIQIRKDLEFQRRRANQFEQKYKNKIKYKNQQEELKKILSQLNQTLTHKENQILQYIKADQQKKRKIADLNTINQELVKVNQQVRLQLSQIQQGAISAILEKDNIIQDLQQKIISLQNIDVHGLQSTIVQLQQKYKELEDRSEAEKRQAQGIIDMKDEQIRQIRDKFDIQRQRYEDKINLLEQEIVSYQKHIQKINQQRNHEENLEQKYYLLEQKQRKTQKKLQQIQNAFKTQKQDLIQAIQKLQSEIQNKNQQTEQLKNLKNTVKQLQKQIKNKKKQIQDSKHSHEKSKSQYLKKISQLEQQKKKVSDTLQIKSNQLQRLRLQVQQNMKAVKTPQKKQKSTENHEDKTKVAQKQYKITETDGSSLMNDLQNLQKKSLSRRQSNEENLAMIQKLKAQIKQLQQQIQSLNDKLGEEMKQVQTLRERLVSQSGSAGRSDIEAKVLVQIQDLNSYIKKIQHSLMITKLKYAEDENYWGSRQSAFKKQIQKIDKKSKKQKAQLIQRIQRMKKTNAKDKKIDYYQSSLK